MPRFVDNAHSALAEDAYDFVPVDMRELGSCERLAIATGNELRRNGWEQRFKFAFDSPNFRQFAFDCLDQLWVL